MSYVNVADFRSYAQSIGVSLPDDDDAVLILLTRASDFIDSKEPDLRGQRTERGQPHAYPRRNLVINGFAYGDDEIPDLVKRCQMALALEANNGVDLFASIMDLPVIEERVEGAVTVRYASPTKIEPTERNSEGMALLRQLMRGLQPSISLVRV